MILNALYEYYNRSKKKNNLPVFGMEYKEIGFLIVIDRNGRFVRFEDRRIDEKHAQTFLVKKAVGRTSAPCASYLYDNSKYVFGFSDKEDSEHCRRFYDVFKDKVLQIAERIPNDGDLAALKRFYAIDLDVLHSQMRNDPLWDVIVKSLNKKFSVFSFLIEGDTEILAEKGRFFVLQENEDEKGASGVCLVSGKRSKLVETTTASLISGGQPTGSKLVSFQTKSGYDSYGKEKGLNAPIGEEAEFAYTTALNYMLRGDSRNKFIVGSRTFIFWASADNEACTQAEEGLFSLFSFKKEDDPDQNIQKVQKVFTSIYSGVLSASSSDRFYILGLAPNSARIAVVYWAEIPLKEFARTILNHFDDMEIQGKQDCRYKGLYAILGAVTLGGKASDAAPNLPDALIKSIFEGKPYPYTLLSNCIRRIRAESSDKQDSVLQGRAAILKAYLIRENKQQIIQTMLDKQNENAGYLCGRLFAVLDKIQEEANRQHTIRERYMNSASSTPSAVFSTILNLSSHHSDKLSDGRNIYFERIKQEIIDKIPASGFPNNLDLQDQGRFFIGYYHQRQDFFTAKDKENENN
jgi:CRISPR-associated protein Csd1